MVWMTSGLQISSRRTGIIFKLTEASIDRSLEITFFTVGASDSITAYRGELSCHRQIRTKWVEIGVFGYRWGYYEGDAIARRRDTVP